MEDFGGVFPFTVAECNEPLPEMDEDQEQLSTALKTKLQRDVNLSTAVDRSLLGGVIIRTEDTVIDNSVRGKLEKLAQQLA